MKTKIVPFDVKMAKDIQDGKIKGRIKTRKGASVRIVAWDMKCRDNAPILALIDCGREEAVIAVDVYGKEKIGPTESMFDLVLEVLDNEPQFNSPYSIEQLNRLKEYTEQLMEVNQGVIDDLDNLVQDLKRICEPPEQKHEFKAGDKVRIHCEGDQYDNNIGEVVDVLSNVLHVRVKALPFPYKINEVEFIAHGRVDNSINSESSKHEFKPFDKVLVREDKDDFWHPDIFSMWHGQFAECIGHDDIEYIIPYEGNEHLVGTTDKSKED